MLHSVIRYKYLLAEALKQPTPVAVLLIGLDGINDVRDIGGQSAVDAVLQSVGSRLLSAAPQDTILAQLSRDQFAIMASAMGNQELVQGTAKKILATFDQPFETGRRITYLSAHIGIALALRPGGDVDAVLASAELALHYSRCKGARRIQMFNPGMRRAKPANSQFLNELRSAFRNGEFELHYQPQISLEDGQVHGAEALLRWRHPKRGVLTPVHFISELEDSPLALPVGWWILDEACRQVVLWRRSGMVKMRVGVNLFAEQFRSPMLVHQVSTALEKHGLDPLALELEITETIALLNDDSSAVAMRDLRALGVSIAFDDFGTGYACLSSLQRFPLTTLKIDRSFVSDIVGRPRDVAIVRALVAMGNELGLSTIAEGIETTGQETALRSLGCRVGQGYRYGRPAVNSAFEAAISGRSVGLQRGRWAVGQGRLGTTSHHRCSWSGAAP